MFAHAQQKYSRSVHLRFVAAQDFMIRRCMPRTPQVIGSADDMLDSGVAHFDHLIWPTWVVILCIISPGFGFDGF